MKLSLVVVGDGRAEYLQQTLASARDAITHPITTRIMIDDSGDTGYGQILEQFYPEFVHVHGGRRGLAGAVQAGFDAALASDPDYVFWLEEDWLFERPVEIKGMADVLDIHPELATMTLKRGIEYGNAHEVAAGGWMEADPASYHDRDGYVEHIHNFSLNPGLLPRKTLELGWPSGPIGTGNEDGMTGRCLDAGYRFAYWGQTTDPPAVIHIGQQRARGLDVVNVTALFAHPDDELFAAGTLARFAAEGHRVTLWTLFVDQREPALRKCAELLDLELLDPQPLSEDDFTWSRYWVRTLEPFLPPTDLLISHRVEDPNTSHGHIGRMARTFARKNKMSVWEVDRCAPGGVDPDAPSPNVTVDISSFVAQKRDVLGLYDVITEEQQEMIELRDRFNGAQAGVRAAEMFRLHKAVWL